VADPAQVLLALHPRITPPEFAVLNALGSMLPPPPPPEFPLLVLLTQLAIRTPLADAAGHAEKVARHCELHSELLQEVTGT